MKAIINGKRYDTDQATLIGEAAHGLPGDFDRWEAGLYVTSAGNYFLAGYGGARTQWSLPVPGGGYGGGEGIIPLSPAEALEWAEEHLSPEVVEEHFGAMIEDA